MNLKHIESYEAPHLLRSYIKVEGELSHRVNEIMKQKEKLEEEKEEGAKEKRVSHEKIKNVFGIPKK